jgi:transposase InsO family protein
MKAQTMKAKMEELGVLPSYSRPRVSDDNPYSEALFRTRISIASATPLNYATKHIAS